MKFSIITPTYRRSELLKRAVESVINQTHKDWELIIINDTPGDTAYLPFASSINDARIRYYVNTTNRGVNFSRNFGLDNVSADSKWVIFLDDDDFFAPDTLKNFYNLILLRGEDKWFLTNRALRDGTPLTLGVKDETYYTYAWDYLLFKRIKGDATHCIETKLINQNHIRFLKQVKQGEEWFFFYQLGKRTRLFYSDHNSTISDGYDPKAGLNFRKRSFQDKYSSLLKIIHASLQEKMFDFPLIVYILLRTVKLLIGK